MEVTVEKKKRRATDDPVISAQAAEWIHVGVQMLVSVMDPTPTPPTYVFTYICLYIHMNVS